MHDQQCSRPFPNSRLRAWGPLVYFLLPVCRDVHGANVIGYVLLILKLLEVIVTLVYIAVSIVLLFAIFATEVQDVENVCNTFVITTIVMVALLLLYWVLHFINACASGCTFCSSYGGGDKNADFTLKNGYNDQLCKKWDETNNTGFLLLFTFPLCAAIEAALLLYFAAVVNGIYEF